MEDKATLRELREKYFVDRRWKDLVDVLQREIPVTDDREERLDLYELLGSVYVDHLEDADKAFDAFRTVIDLRDDWNDVDALEVYQQLLDLDPEFEPAFERAEEILQRDSTPDAARRLAVLYLDFANGAAADGERFLEYHRRAAELFESRLNEPDAALIILCTSLTIETWHTGILDEIERLAERTDGWSEPIEKLRSVATEMTQGPPSAQLHRRLGTWMLRSGIGDPVQHLRIALQYAPDPELAAQIRGLLQDEGRYDELVSILDAQRRNETDPQRAEALRRDVVQTLTAAAEHTQGLERANLLAKIGDIFEHEKGDRLTAVRYWEQALNADADHLDAARPLIDHYLDENRWERAAPVLEGVVKAAENSRGLLEPRELNQRYIQYGMVLDKVGNEKLALHAYRQAYEIDRSNPRTLERLGNLLFQSGELDQAYHLFIQLADRHERAISPEVLLDSLRKAARIKHRLNDHRVAMGLIDRAVRLKPDDREALRLASEIADASGDKELAAQARKRLVESESDPRVKFTELVRMGDAFVEDGEAVEQGAKAYVAALEIEPKSVSVLRKLLGAFQAMERWRESIGVLERLVELESDRMKRSNLYYTMGIVARDRAEAPERAVGFFDRALDEDPHLLKAFEAIDRIFTDLRSWKDLERAYRRMLHRVAETEVPMTDKQRADLNFLLWSAIGEIYRSRVGDLKTAMEAYEAALGIRDDDNIRMILADLYQRTGANTDGALVQHRKLLEKDPMRAESYHALFRGYLDRRRFDAAFCVSGVLDFIDAAEWDESDFYRKYLGLNLRLAKSPFYPELLDRVYPREQNRLVNAIMAHLTIALRDFFAHPIKDFGVHPRKDRIADDDNRLLIAQMYRYVAGILGFQPPPHLYKRVDHPLGMRILNSDPPAFLVGSDMLADSGDDRGMVFELGKLLSWMRPEHFLAAIGNGPQELMLIFTSAMDWVAGRSPSGGRDGAALVKRLKSAPSQTQMQIQALMSQYMQRASGPPDIGQWLTQAEHATSRFGLILCGDIRTATDAIRSQPQAMTLASVEERVIDLVAYSASEDYFQVRKDLGLAIG